MVMAQIRDMARLVAMTQLGVAEVGGNNRGKQVEEYLAAARLPPGQAWCAAFVIWAYDRAATRLKVANPLPRLGHVGHFFRWIQERHGLWVSNVPTLGAIACHQEVPGDRDAPGHMGILLELPAVPGGKLIDLSGNTNDKGSRAGRLVGRNARAQEYWNLGFIDIGRFGPLEAA